MEKSNNGKILSKDEIQEIFGPPPPRKPIPSNSFNTLVRIFSLFPDQNPFSDYASSVNLPECLRRHDDNNINNLKRRNSGNVHDDSVVDRGEKESFDELVGPGSVEDGIFLRNDTNNDVAVRVPCKDDNFSGSDELDKMTRTTKTMNRAGSDEKAIDARIADVQKIPEAFSVIENILMDESDDKGLLRLPEKDISFDFLNDLGSILDTDLCVDNTLAAESRKIKLTVEGDMKEDVANEVKKKDGEVNRLAPESCVANYQGNLALDKEMSNQVEAKNQYADTCFGNLQCKEQNRCTEKVSNELSELEGWRYLAQESSNKGALVSSSYFANSIDKGNESGIAVKGKSKKAKKGSLNGVVSAKHKHMSVQGETPNSTKSKYVEPLIHEQMVKKHEVGKSSTKKVKEGQDKSSKGVQYTRQQLLCLQNKISVSDDILRALQGIAADLHDEGQHSAAGETRVSCTTKRKPSHFEGNKAQKVVITDANKEKQSFSTDNKLAKEEKTDSSILKKKKRGSSSEARKEKKKRQRSKKRAALNKKLGVRRLKLKPVLKPKVVSHCRHYLQGRCHEGEKCKFSHDVIPLTKSKPCCHFARNACMKGDECPFDHQLSKYPCNNYVTTGFCVRGDSCSFSHKAPSAEQTEPVSFVSKSDSSSLLQFDESNSKQKFNASIALASGYATRSSLKGNSVRLTSQPANAPKGISFLSFGKSSVEDSFKHNGGELSKQSSVLPSLAVGSSSKSSDDGTGTTERIEPVLCVSKCDFSSLFPLDESNSKQKLNATTSLESGYVTPNSLQGISVRLTSQPANAPKGISSLSFGKSSVENSSKHKGGLSQQYIVLPNVAVRSSSKRSDYGAGTNNQLSQGLSSRVVNFSQMLKDGKSQATIPTHVHTDSLIGEIGTVNDSDNLKTVQPELPDSSTSLGQCSAKVGGVRNTQSAAVKSLSSTLAFAEKYVSAMKMPSVPTFKVVDKNERASDSGSKQNEESKASAILQFLYSGGNKEQG